MGVPSRGCGITTDKSNNEIVKCGFLFAECGIIRPYAICNMARKIFSCFWYVITSHVALTMITSDKLLHFAFIYSFAQVLDRFPVTRST